MGVGEGGADSHSDRSLSKASAEGPRPVKIESPRPKEQSPSAAGEVRAGAAAVSTEAALRALGKTTPGVLDRSDLQNLAGAEENPQAISGSETATPLTPDRTKAYLKEISLQAKLTLEGTLEPAQLQKMVDETVVAGVPREQVMSVLKAAGVPVVEKSAVQAEAKPQFDPNEPIDAREYVALASRLNEAIRGYTLRRDQENRAKLSGLPLGRILDAAWPDRDTVATREAYNQIKRALDELGVP